MPDQDATIPLVILESMKAAPLKVIFIIHFILITWGVQGYWKPDSYLFYNLLFILILLWSIHKKDSEEPVFLCWFVDLSSILFDLIVLCVYFPRLSYGSSEQFSFAMAILNLVFRPVSCLVLYKQSKERSSASSPGHAFGVPHTSRQPRNYQDIEGQQSFPGIDDTLPPTYH